MTARGTDARSGETARGLDPKDDGPVRSTRQDSVASPKGRLETVEGRHREAAAGLAEALCGQDGINRLPERFRSAKMDHAAAVQAFARFEREHMATTPPHGAREAAIEAGARAMLKPWAHRDFTEEELAPARKDAAKVYDAILSLLSPAQTGLREADRMVEALERIAKVQGDPISADIANAALAQIKAVSIGNGGREICDLCQGTGKNMGSQAWPDYPPSCRSCKGTGRAALTPSSEPQG